MKNIKLRKIVSLSCQLISCDIENVNGVTNDFFHTFLAIYLKWYIFHKSTQSEKKRGLVGPSQQLVDLIVKMGGTLEKAPCELTDAQFEDIQQELLSLHAYFK